MRRAFAIALALSLLTGCANRYEERREQATAMLHEIVAPERNEQFEFQRDVRARLVREDFAGLSALADSLRRTRARFSDDRYALEVYTRAFGLDGTTESRNEEAWAQIVRHLEAWRRAQPENANADLALAHACVNLAWHARGGGVATTVTDSGWTGFRAQLRRARAVLDTAGAKGPRTLDWYLAMQRVSLGLSWPSDESESLFRHGQAQDSTCEVLYWMRAYYLMPRWHGVPGEFEAWLANAVRPLPPEEADRIYAYACIRAASISNSLFEETDLSWGRARRGLEVLRRRHPESFRLMDWTAYLAAEAADAATARTMLARIGPRVDLDTWRSKRYFADVHQWAQEATATQPASAR